MHVKLIAMSNSRTVAIRTVRPSADLSGTGACVSFVLRRAARAVTRCFDDALRPAGLRSTQFTILIAVAKCQPISIGELAELVAMESTTMSRSIALLDSGGLVRVEGRAAGRRKLVTLTMHGARLLANAMPRWRATQKRILALGSGVEWSVLGSKLDRLAARSRGLARASLPARPASRRL
jgi:DNA-binding MarR family transcriptional regulator